MRKRGIGVGTQTGTQSYVSHGSSREIEFGTG